LAYLPTATAEVLFFSESLDSEGQTTNDLGKLLCFAQIYIENIINHAL